MMLFAPIRPVTGSVLTSLSRALVPIYVDVMRFSPRLRGVRFSEVFDKQRHIHQAFGDAFGYSRPFQHLSAVQAEMWELSMKSGAVSGERVARSPIEDVVPKSNLQRRTMLKLLMLYNVEWHAAQQGSYGGAISVRLRLGLRRRIDQKCREMIEVARRPRRPAPPHVVARIERAVGDVLGLNNEGK